MSDLLSQRTVLINFKKSEVVEITFFAFWLVTEAKKLFVLSNNLHNNDNTNCSEISLSKALATEKQ